MARPSSLCVNENELLAWVAGHLPEARTLMLEAHVDTCECCQVLLGEAARGSRAPTQREPRSGDTFVAGELVADRYRVTKFLGHGGMGEVYEVYDSWLNASVALKTLVAPIADDPSALARLKAEVLLARRVSHRNVCRVFDFGFAERPEAAAPARVPFLTMELLHGETLKSHLRTLARLDLETARPLLLQIMAGLAHAHAMGVVHRDLKPENVMLVAEPGALTRAVLMDFGLARSALFSAGSLTSANHGALGTIDYMAPEQIQGGSVTARSDLYALGVLMFELATGRLPFEGGSPFVRACHRISSDAPRASTVVPNVDAGWETAIARCLARDPGQRFGVASDLLPFIEQQPTPRNREHEQPPLSRNRVRWAVGLALTFAVSASAPIYARRAQDQAAGKRAATTSAASPSAQAATVNPVPNNPPPPVPAPDSAGPDAPSPLQTKPASAQRLSGLVAVDGPVASTARPVLQVPTKLAGAIVTPRSASPGLGARMHTSSNFHTVDRPEQSSPLAAAGSPNPASSGLSSAAPRAPVSGSFGLVENHPETLLFNAELSRRK